jgi:hypothetical protein
MHANFVLCLLSSSSTSSSSSDHSTRTCLQSCGICLRRFCRRFWFCLVLCVWSLSFTATIPLLYTIDSNEKTPKPVYCPGTTQISYMEEWFDRNRFTQSLIFNYIPLLATIFISIIALLKLFYDCLFYTYLRLKTSRCSPCRTRSSQHQQQGLTIPNSISILSSLGMVSNNNMQSGINLAPIIESPTPTTSETTISSSNLMVQSCGHWCSTSFLRFLLVLSCCLLACIYPIVMRYYLVYFSVLVPLIFAVLNYSLGQLTPRAPPTEEITNTIITPTEQQINTENRHMTGTTVFNSPDTNTGKISKRNSSLKRERDYSNEQFELQSPLMTSSIHENDGIDEPEQFLVSPSSSSQSSTTPTIHSHHRHHRTPITGKQKYFSNNLYENYSRNTFIR